MPLSASIFPMLASPMFGGWEIVMVLAVALLLFGSKRLPELVLGLRKGIDEFKKATFEITDKAAFDAGRSAGGIYGKAAAQALTVDNHVAELYDPAVFQKKSGHHKRTKLLLLMTLVLRRLRKFLSKAVGLLISRKHP